MVKPFGPHQCLSCSASVQARQTRARGASSTRVITSSSPDASGAALVLAGLVVTRLLLGLHFAQVVFEPIEALLPEQAPAFQPGGECREWGTGAVRRHGNRTVRLNNQSV